MAYHHGWFVEQMGRGAEEDGFPRIAGRLFAELLLSDEPRNLDELAEALGVSKASVSTDARRLLDRGVVERRAKPGDRRDYYCLSPDFFSQIVRHRLERWTRVHELVRDMAREPATSDLVRERVAYVSDAHDFLLGRIREALDEWQQEQRSKRGRTRVPARSPRARTTKGARASRG
jgi:DNA-binding transcriptional regulator GbsR (MarR family)